jgi:hypothetical protein
MEKLKTMVIEKEGEVKRKWLAFKVISYMCPS